MPYKTGSWGVQAQARSKRRKQYFDDYFLAKKLGKSKRRATTGAIGEALSRIILTSSDWKDTTGYDLVWAGQRVEVKCSSYLPKFKGYKFSISEAQLELCDYALLIALTPKGDLFAYWFLPSSELKHNMRIREGNLAKYAPYLVETKTT